MKCPKCGKELPQFYSYYTDEACHEIHVNLENCQFYRSAKPDIDCPMHMGAYELIERSEGEKQT